VLTSSDTGRLELAADGVERSPVATPRVAVLVLNWNGCEETLGCLATLVKQEFASSELIVIDNGSVDDSRASIVRHYPGVKLLSTGSNLGFAGGNNVGLRHVLGSDSADYILILNNDTLAPRNFIASLVETALANGKRSIVAPLILDNGTPPRVWYNGARWDPTTCTFEVDSKTYGSGPLQSETQIATGCALFAPVEAFREVGLFDERLFLMHEESDWCFRASRIGYKLYVTQRTSLTHLVSVSFGGAGSALQRYFDVRNRLYFAQWNLTASQVARTFGMCVVGILVDAMGLASWAPAPEWRLSPRRWYWSFRRRRAQPEPQNVTASGNLQVKAQVAGLVDYIRRRTGDCPAYIRTDSRKH
jgi:GT2 family glycosyltransferase